MISLKLAGAALALSRSAQALAVGGLADVNVYDRYRNLVAMGVIRETRRSPRPFPGFVPDA